MSYPVGKTGGEHIDISIYPSGFSGMLKKFSFGHEWGLLNEWFMLDTYTVITSNQDSTSGTHEQVTKIPPGPAQNLVVRMFSVAGEVYSAYQYHGAMDDSGVRWSLTTSVSEKCARMVTSEGARDLRSLLNQEVFQIPDFFEAH
jgi:hypothetical protein